MNGREEDFLPSLEKSVTLLAVSSLPADRDRLRQLLSHGNSELHEASDCRQGRDYADGNWEDLLTATERLLAPPNAVVCSLVLPKSRSG
jgi:hypothetical protein